MLAFVVMNSDDTLLLSLVDNFFPNILLRSKTLRIVLLPSDICPGGKEMKHTRRTYSDPARNAPEWKARKYRALKSDCIDCPLKAKCCPKTEMRAIHREKYEIVRAFARQCIASDFNQTASNRRKKVEMLFTHLKHILGLARLRLRDPCGVLDEFTLAATAQNLRKLAKLKPMGPAAE